MDGGCGVRWLLLGCAANVAVKLPVAPRKINGNGSAATEQNGTAARFRTSDCSTLVTRDPTVTESCRKSLGFLEVGTSSAF
jgi:hypothetical protein